MVDHFGRNHRLEWAFRVCRNLGIDDPCHWLDSVSPLVVDQWIAFEIYCIKSEEKSKPNSPVDPMDALTALNSAAGRL